MHRPSVVGPGRHHATASAPSGAVIRLLVVDDHPAVLAGLVAVLRSEPGLVPVGAAGRPDEALTRAEHRHADVALVDYHLQESDGLVLCRRLKALRRPPGVLVYSAFADKKLAIPAIVAGADALVDKGAPTDELLDAIRAVARGATTMPRVPPELMAATAARLDPVDLPILGMLMDRTPAAEIARVLRIDEPELESRLANMLQRLKVPPAPVT